MVTTVRFPDELHMSLRAAAEKRGMTLNAYLISVLWDEAADGEADKADETERGGERKMDKKNVKASHGKYVV